MTPVHLKTYVQMVLSKVALVESEDGFDLRQLISQFHVWHR